MKNIGSPLTLSMCPQPPSGMTTNLAEGSVQKQITALFGHFPQLGPPHPPLLGTPCSIFRFHRNISVICVDTISRAQIDFLGGKCDFCWKGTLGKCKRVTYGEAQ